MGIKKVCKILQMMALSDIALILLFVVLFETDVLPAGVLFSDDSDIQRVVFWITTVMELLTIILIPVALRLFRFTKVNTELKEQGAPALQKWGALRIEMLLAPAVADTILYYFTGFNVAFAYLAIISLIALVFIWPSQSRCEEEAGNR